MRGLGNTGSFTKKKKEKEAPVEDADSGRSLVHGAVRFPGSRSRPAKWARLSHETSMADTMQLITRTWGVTPPSSLISIIGSNPRQLGGPEQSLFGPGLKRAAETTNAWILTDGAHEGIGGLVGPHVQPLPCLGVQNWSNIVDNDKLKPSRTTIVSRVHRRSTAGVPRQASHEHQPAQSTQPPQQSSPPPARSVLHPSPPPSPPEASPVPMRQPPPSLHASPADIRRPSNLSLSSASSFGKLPGVAPSTGIAAASNSFPGQAGAYGVAGIGAGSSIQQMLDAYRGLNPKHGRRNARTRAPSADFGDPTTLHLDSSHTHFVLVDGDWAEAAAPASFYSRTGTSEPSVDLTSEPSVDLVSDPARDFREALERHITLTERGDGYKVPSVTVVVNGDIFTLRSVLERLQAGLPVVVLGDTGGAAADLFNYSLTSTLPPAGTPPEGRDAQYLLEASELIPMIVKEGAEQGGSTKPKLAFFLANFSIDDTDIDFSIMQSMLNSCSSINEEIMLAVGWGDMAILEEVLERAPTHDHEGLSLALQLALGRRDIQMVEVLIDLAASPRYVELQRLFVVDFNRYRLKGASAEQWRDTSPAAIKLRQAMTRRRDKKAAKRKSCPWMIGGSSAAAASPQLGSLKCLDPSAAALKCISEEGAAARGKGGGVVLGGAKLAAGGDGGEGGGGGGSFGPVSPLKLQPRPSSAVNFSLGRTFTRVKGDETQPFAILADWVEGYHHSVSARYHFDVLVPNWMDLMLWAVLTGEEQLVQPLWAKTRDPLRAALLASKCCQKLSTLPHLRSDQAHLLKLSAEYEDWAIGLLDAVDEPDAALPLLAMIPSLGQGHPLWPDSSIEIAVDFAGKAVPCRRFVAHRHSQYLLEAFFAGDYPRSQARVPIDAHLMQVMVQCLFFFIPGTFCEVMPTSAAVVEKREGSPRNSGSRGDDAPGHSLLYQRVDDDVDDEDLDVWDDARFSARPLDTPHSESGFADVYADLRSQRWRHFFSVPKVKFVMYLTFHGLHLVLLMGTAFFASGSLSNGLRPEISATEIGFWAWTLLFVLAELKEWRSYDLEGLRMYFRSGWNKLDCMNILCTGGACFLRVTCQPMELTVSEANATLLDIVVVDWKGGLYEQCSEERYARTLYSVVTFLLYWKLLSYAEYYESIGVHVIIMKQVVQSDVVIFGFLLLLVSCGIGSGFSLLLARYDHVLMDESDGARTFSRPFFIPWWTILEPPEVTDMEEASGTEFPTRLVVPVALFMHAFILIVLINLLIAAMTETYQRLHDESTLYYLYERARLIEEFKRKGALPPPLNFFSFICHDVPIGLSALARYCFGPDWQNGRFIMGCLRAFAWLRPGARPRDGFKLLPGPSQQRTLYRRGRAVLKRFLLRRSREQEKHLDFQVGRMQRRVDKGFEGHNKNLEHLRMTLIAMTDRLERLELRGTASAPGAAQPYGGEGEGSSFGKEQKEKPRRHSDSQGSHGGGGGVLDELAEAGELHRRRAAPSFVPKQPRLGSEDAGRKAAGLNSFYSVVMAAAAAARAERERVAAMSSSSSAQPSSAQPQGADQPSKAAVQGTPIVRAGTQQALEGVSARDQMFASPALVAATPGPACTAASPSPARRVRVAPSSGGGSGLSREEALAERQELRQEGALHAKPLKVRAPSERQKRKPGANRERTAAATRSAQQRPLPQAATAAPAAAPTEAEAEEGLQKI